MRSLLLINLATAAATSGWVLPPGGTLLRQVADGFAQRHGIGPQAGWVETLDTALARALVLQSDNLWFTPRGVVQADLGAGTLRRLNLDLTPDEAVGLVLRAEPLPGVAVQTFVSAVRQCAAAMRQRRPRSGR